MRWVCAVRARCSRNCPAVDGESPTATTLASALSTAWEDGDVDHYAMLSIQATLLARTATTADLVDMVSDMADVALTRGLDGLDGPLLALASEAWTRGASEAELTEALAPIAFLDTPPLGSGPTWSAVGAGTGYGARFVRADVLRAATADLLAHPGASLDTHLGRGLCALSAGELEARYGAEPAAQIHQLCDSTSLGGAHGLLGGLVTDALSDFDCLLGQSNGQPFDQTFTQATQDCLDSLGGQGSDLAEGGNSSQTYNPDGSITHRTEGSDGSWSERQVWPNGCEESRAMTADGAMVKINITPDGERRTEVNRLDGSHFEEETPGYQASKEQCEDCSDEGEPIAQTDDGGSEGSGADSGDETTMPGDSTDECDELGELLREHAGQQVPQGNEDGRPRDWVSYPSPETDVPTDALDCFQVFATDLHPSANCGLVQCEFGEVPDPSSSCACTPVVGDIDALLGTVDCGAVIDCGDGVAVMVNGVCTCQGGEVPDGGEFDPNPFDRWSWR